jgi:hypothetical protein
MVTAARWAGTAVRLTRPLFRSVPGILGAAAVSLGAGELAGHIFGRGLAPWAALTVAGGFALWIGAAINAPPPAPPAE